MNDITSQTLGRYQILNEIGKGAMGKVYLAEHIYTGKKVAVKTLLTGWLSDLSYSERLQIEERFRREAQAASQIDHENVVQIYDFDVPKSDSPAYIAMEFIEGESLEKVLAKEGKIPLNKAILWMLQILSGICESHQKGFVHRDLKPANIMIISSKLNEEAERVKIIDYGIAKVFDSELTKITKHGQLIGTAKYMSPEQCKAEDGVSIDGRSDVYSLGLIFYEMLVGYLPFKSNTYEGWILCQLVHTPEDLPNFIPTEIRNLIMSSLEKEQIKRLDSVAVMRKRLEAFQFAEMQKIIQEEKLREEIRIKNLVENEKNILSQKLKAEFKQSYFELEDRMNSIRKDNEHLKLLNIESEKKIGYLASRLTVLNNKIRQVNDIEKLLKELKDNHLEQIIKKFQMTHEEAFEENVNFGEILKALPKETQKEEIDEKNSFASLMELGEQIALREREEQEKKEANQFQKEYKLSRYPVGTKIRVYDLAKELKQDTKRIIEELRREGLDIDVPSNSVPKEIADKIRHKYFPKKESAPARTIKVIREENSMLKNLAQLWGE